MEQAIQELKNYSRWLRLEVTLPRLREALEEAKELRIDATAQVQVAKWELERLERPGFLQRLRGGLEEEKEAAFRALRNAEGKLQSAREEVELRTRELETARAEFDTLSSSWDSYLREKDKSGECSEEETTILKALAVGLAGDTIDALEKARPWMQMDVRYTYVREGNRKMEFLALAAEKARRLRAVAEQLPEGMADIPDYLLTPESYVTDVTMEYWQLDRLNKAIDQVRMLRSSLK